MKDIVGALKLNDHLVLEFLACFARFEYALKRSGYASGTEKEVRADWDAFALTLKILPDQEIQAVLTAGELLLNNPPQKQVLIAGSLDWKDGIPEGQADVQKILIYVRRVRNNLFHGGKFLVPTGPVDEPARNQALIDSSLAVLQAVLAVPASKKVAEAFLPDA